MREAMFFGAMVVLSILVGIMSNELGVTQSSERSLLCGNDPVQSNEPCFDPPNDPGKGNILDQIMAPFRYIFDAIGAFFKIITYQVEGVHPLVSTVMLVPISVSTVWLVLRLIRGGG